MRQLRPHVGGPKTYNIANWFNHHANDESTNGSGLGEGGLGSRAAVSSHSGRASLLLKDLPKLERLVGSYKVTN